MWHNRKGHTQTLEPDSPGTSPLKCPFQVSSSEMKHKKLQVHLIKNMNVYKSIFKIAAHICFHLNKKKSHCDKSYNLNLKYMNINIY